MLTHAQRAAHWYKVLCTNDKHRRTGRIDWDTWDQQQRAIWNLSRMMGVDDLVHALLNNKQRAELARYDTAEGA